MERLLADAEKFSGVKYDINNLGDVYSAIHVIQQELGLTGVAAAEASETLSGSAGAMKASWENLMAAMSTGEGLEKAMDNMGKSVSAFASNVIRMLGNLMKQMPTLIKALGSKVIEKAPEFIHAGLELMIKLAAGVVQGIPKVIAKLPEIFAKVKASFAGYDWADLGRQLVDGVITPLKTMGESVWNAIKAALSGLGNKIWTWIKDQIRGRGDTGDEGSEGGSGGARSNRAAANSIPRTGGVGAPNRFRPAATKNGGTPEDIASLLRSGIKVQSVVVLEGDARQMLRVVNKANYSDTVRTGKNLLAAKG